MAQADGSTADKNCVGRNYLESPICPKFSSLKSLSPYHKVFGGWKSIVVQLAISGSGSLVRLSLTL